LHYYIAIDTLFIGCTWPPDGIGPVWRIGTHSRDIDPAVILLPTDRQDYRAEKTDIGMLVEQRIDDVHVIRSEQVVEIKTRLNKLFLVWAESIDP
jgi:hypothetical protein